MRWTIRIVLALFATFAVFTADQASGQLIDQFAGQGKDGKLHSVECRPFHCQAYLELQGKLLSAGYPLAGQFSQVKAIREAREQKVIAWLVAAVAAVMAFVGTFFLPKRR